MCNLPKVLGDSGLYTKDGVGVTFCCLVDIRLFHYLPADQYGRND